MPNHSRFHAIFILKSYLNPLDREIEVDCLMSLITCTDCKKEISSKAQACPNCGCPVTSDQRTDLKLTQATGGFEINVGVQEAFRLSVQAAGLVSQKLVPSVIAAVDDGVIYIEAVETHGGWFEPIYRDKVYIKPVSLSPESSLLTNYHFDNETRAEFGERVWQAFLNELYYIITK
jgi:hypothetical protein